MMPVESAVPKSQETVRTASIINQTLVCPEYNYFITKY